MRFTRTPTVSDSVIDGNIRKLHSNRMIQALGTLKMLKDIDQDNVIDGFEFTQFKSLEEAYDNGTFYYPIGKRNCQYFDILIYNKIYEQLFR